MRFRKVPLGLSAVTLMCFLLLAADISLLRVNALLKTQMHQLTNLDPGRPMAELSGLDADGAPDVVGFGARKRPTLVLVFSPTCGVCRANWPTWDAVLRNVRPQARIVAVNLGGHLPSGYLSTHYLGAATVLARPFSEGALENHLQLTPETVVVDANGRVRRAWVGALTPGDAVEVEKMFGKARAVRSERVQRTQRAAHNVSKGREGSQQNGGE